MELGRRAAATSGIDAGYGLRDPSTSHGQMTLDELRLELLKECVRQKLIVEELRELGPEVRRKLRVENAGPLCARSGTPSPRFDASPVRQDGQLQCIPLSSELCVGDALMTREQALMPKRRPAKERIEEWYQPPWRRSGDKDNALISARWPKKTFSGVKRKRVAESSAPNKKRSSGQWTCALCHVNTSSKLTFEERCAGQRHLSNILDLKWSEGMAGLKTIPTAEIYHDMQNNVWDCSICQVKCSGKVDLKNHLKGRRHQENLEALQGEHEEIEGNHSFQEAESYEKKEPHLADKIKRPSPRWNCSICQANCTSESDLDSHLQGRRHRQNVKAQYVEGNSTVLDSLVGGKKQHAVAELSA